MHKRWISTAIATAIASSATAADTKITEQIIITGSRVSESTSEVPASVTVVNADTIAQQLRVTPEIQNMLAIHVPGMAPSTGTSSNSGQTLRGRSALVMIDGVPQSTPLRNGQLGIRTLDASVIERIEVIKGATSIYGNGAAGGVINYITRTADPDGEMGGEVSLSTRFSAVKLEDSVGARLSATVDGRQDKFSYVLSSTYEDTGVERDAEGDILGLVYGLSETTTQNYFTKLGYQIDADQKLQLTYNYYESQQDADLVDITGSVNSGQKTYAIIDRSNEPKPGSPQGPRGNHNLMGKYTNEAAPNTQIVVDGYYQEIENVFFFSETLANPEAGYTGGQSMIQSVKTGLRAGANTVLDTGNVETTLIYGVDALQDVTSQPLLDGRIWVPEMDMLSLAGYLQTKTVVNDEWVLKAGTRRDHIDLSVDDYTTLRLCRNTTTCSAPMDVKGGDINYRSTTYNLGLRYKAVDTFSPFINYSQGSDISDLGRLLRTATVNDISDIQTQASLIDHYEVGFSSTFDRTVFEFTAYRSESELGTGSRYDEATGVYMPVRAPQKMLGFETALDFYVNSDLNLGVTYSWLEGKDTENDVYLGGRQISPPKFTAHADWQVSADSHLSLSYLRVGSRNRFAPIDGNYEGDQGPITHYDVLNLSGYYEMGDWRAYMGIENLLNEDYYAARSQSLTYGGYNTKALGTTVNLGATYSF